MKKIKYNIQDFARFIFDTLGSVKYYPFDGLYDIHLMGKMLDEVADRNEIARNNGEDYEDIEKHMFLAISDYGTHSFDLNDPNSEAYIKNILNNKSVSSRFFIIRLYFNNLTKIDRPYAIVEEYSSEELHEMLLPAEGTVGE